MQYIRYAFLGVLGIVLVSVSLANRGMVTLRLMPDELATFLGVEFAITLPLFVVVLAGIAAGLIIGFVWEWMREYRHRRDVGRKTREVQQLERELSQLKAQKNKGKDDVLALLEDAG